MNRPTPETDAFAIKFKTLCGEKYWVPVDIARKLERARDEARKELEEYRSIAENIGAVKAVYEKEKAIRERDEARDALMKIEEIFVDGENTHDDWFKMGSIAREYFKK